MIPWPSSCSCKHCETILNVLKKQDKEIAFLRNQSGHLLHMLKQQGREIESQREKMNEILWWVSRPPPAPPEPAMQQANFNASPMYVITTNIHGHRFLYVNVISSGTLPPSPFPRRKRKMRTHRQRWFQFLFDATSDFWRFCWTDLHQLSVPVFSKIS